MICFFPYHPSACRRSLLMNLIGVGGHKIPINGLKDIKLHPCKALSWAMDLGGWFSCKRPNSKTDSSLQAAWAAGRKRALRESQRKGGLVLNSWVQWGGDVWGGEDWVANPHRFLRSFFFSFSLQGSQRKWLLFKKVSSMLKIENKSLLKH